MFSLNFLKDRTNRFKYILTRGQIPRSEFGTYPLISRMEGYLATFRNAIRQAIEKSTAFIWYFTGLY